MSQAEAPVLDKTFEAFERELEFQITDPPEHDTRISAFSAALLGLINRDTDVHDVMREMAQTRLERGNATASYLANLSLRATQRAFMYGFLDESFPTIRYPHDYGDTGAWEADLSKVILSETEFQDYMRTREVQSNIADRYSSIKLLVGLYRDRFGDAPAILDVGCSVDHGLKLLEMNQGFYLPALKRAYDGSRRVPVPDGTAARLHDIINEPITIGPSVGVDIVPLQNLRFDIKTRQWVQACSFYPSELLNKRRYAQYLELDGYRPSQVHFQQADFSDEGVSIESREGSGLFNIVVFSTVLYQVSPEKRALMLRNAKRHLESNGIIVVQDFVRVDKDKPNDLEFPEHWFSEEYGYRTLVLDMQDEKAGFEEVFRWSNGRCRQLAPNLGAACLRPIAAQLSRD